MSDPTLHTRHDVSASSSSPQPEERATWTWILLALAAFPAVFFSQATWIAADTKAYLYIDPGRLLSSAQSMWNPDVGMGTVTHQNIGYLFPMGPYYWLIHAVGIPMWVGQRIWLGGLFLVAGGGVLFVSRLLKINAAGRFAGAMLYMLSPFVLDYISRSTALLMPWAGFGWMLGFTILALRTRQWRYPALFALVVAAVGGVNATSILFVGIAPVIWIFYAAALRECTWRTAWQAIWRIGALSALVSLWWAGGLWAEGAYGLNVLRFTETIPTVVMTSSSAEVFRGLGYWYFYGWDKIQPWTLTAEGFVVHAIPILISFSVPALALLTGFVARWRYRAFAVTMIAVGVIFAVSAYPLDHPTPFGTLLKTAGEQSTVGLAMRSTNRVMPLVILGLALLLGSGITALSNVRNWYGIAVSALASLLAMANLAPLYQGNLIASNLKFPNNLPTYVTNTAGYLNAQGPSTRVLGLPGVDFGYYRWGVTMDQVWQGLLTRPWVSRQSVPSGEPASANLVRALDTSIQDGLFDPSTVAPLAQLMSAGDVLLQSDLQYERYAGTHPQPLFDLFQPTPAGLGVPKTFGPAVGAETLIGPIYDEAQLGVATSAPKPPSLAVYPVANPRAQIRSEATTAPVLIAGDGEGLLESTAFGLISNKNVLFYSGSLPTKKAFARATSPGTAYVVTDSNAKRLDAFGTLSENYGYVQTATDTPLKINPSEQALGMFPGAGTATQTIALLGGAKSISATSYGYPTANFPENQPFNAFDGNSNTAWEAGGVTSPLNEKLRITLLHPVTTDHIRFLQPQTGPTNRKITTVNLTFDGTHTISVALDRSSYSLPGQTVTFSPRRFTTLTITITGATGSTIFQSNLSAVGFAEVAIGGVAPATESLRLPTDLLTKAGASSASHPLAILTHRLRSNGLYPRTDPELSMRRTVILPTARQFTVSSKVRVADSISDTALNILVGRTTSTTIPAAQGTGAVPIVQTASSSRLAGDLNASSWAANDNNPETAWQSAFTDSTGQWISTTLASPITLDHLGLRIVNDGGHAVPTSVTVSAGGVDRTVALPALSLGRDRPQGATTLVPLSFAPITGSTVRLTINSVKTLTDPEIGKNGGLPSPIGIAELGIPGIVEPATPPTLAPSCRTDLVAVNGQPLGLSVSGTTSDALDSRALAATACGTPSSTVTLDAGTNLITTAEGLSTQWNVDELGLLSAPDTAPTVGVADAAPVTVHVTHANRWSASGTLQGTGRPSWLVLGQSLSSGWHASLNGKDLGAPTLIDGYANGWKIPPLAVGSTGTVSFVWAPQRLINITELLSLLGVILAFVLAVWPTTARRRQRELAWEVPALSDPLRYEGEDRTGAALLGASLAIGVLVGIFTSPVGGVGAALLAAIGLRYRRSRVLFFLGCAGAIGLAGLYTAALQHRHAFPWIIQWPQNFPWSNTLGWTALSLLVIDAVVGITRTGLRRSRSHLVEEEEELGDAPT